MLEQKAGQGILPFYCDPKRVGAFAVTPADLAAGGDSALFRLLVTLSMYQALRDVVIMRRQRSMKLASVRVVADLARVSTGGVGYAFACRCFWPELKRGEAVKARPTPGCRLLLLQPGRDCRPNTAT